MTRRRRGVTRPAKTPILIVTNGRQTEHSYLLEIKRRASADLSGLAITVQFLNGSPRSVVSQLQRPKSDVGAYAEVWIVVDEDGEDLKELVSAVERLSTRRQSWHLIVSRPCFEVWLTAHVEPVRKYATQKEAQEHFLSTAGDRRMPKVLPERFPFDRIDEASIRSRLAGVDLPPLGELPPSPGSAMVHLLRRLGLLADDPAP